MNKLIAKAKKNTLFLISAIFFTVIVVLLIVSALVYFISTKDIVNNYFDESIYASQKNLIQRIDDTEQALNKTTYQIISSPNIYDAISDKVQLNKEIKDAINDMNVFISTNDLTSCYIIRKHDKALFNQRLLRVEGDSFENHYMPVEEIINNVENGNKIQSPYKTDAVFIIATYDYRGYYVIYVYDKDYFFNNVLGSFHYLYNISIYCNDSLLYASNTDTNASNDKITYTSGKYRVESYSFEAMKKSFSEPFLREFIPVVIFIASIITFLFVLIFLFFKKFEKHTNTFITNSNQYQKMKIKQTLQKAIITKNITQQEQDFVNNYIKAISYQNIYCCYVQLDDIEHLLIANSHKNIVHQTQNIQSVLNSVLSPLGDCVFVDTDIDSFGIVFLSSSILTPEEITEKIVEAKETIEKHHSLTITTTLSEPITSSNDVCYTLIYVSELKDQRFFTGYNSIIYESEELNIKNQEYPKDYEKNIVHSFTLGQSQKLEHYLSLFFEYTKETSYEYAQNWCTRLIFTLIDNSDLTDSSNLLSSFYKLDTLEKKIEFLKSYFLNIISKNQKTETISNEAFMQQSNRLIEENYNNLDFNLTSFANEINLSPAYAGQKFKKIYNRSFNSYLVVYRINSAIEIIKNNENKSISEIASMCGFSNASYFITSFKKVTGYTPTEYKTQLFN